MYYHVIEGQGIPFSTCSLTIILLGGMTSAHRSSGSFSGLSNNAVKEPRSSLDSERSFDVGSPPTLQNGVHDHSPTNGVEHPDDTDDPVEKLQRELARTKEEKDKLASQYNSLLARLTQMRTTLGTKLQQDAVSPFPR